MLCNFFANNNDRISQQINSEELNFKKVTENYKFKSIPNFNEITDSLAYLQVQISAIGNINLEKM